MFKKTLFVFILTASMVFLAFAQEYEAAKLINSKNWAQYIGDHLGFYYDSHGCLHFTPSDIYLLTKTIPPGSALVVKNYDQKDLPAGFSDVPFFRDKINSEQDVQKYAYDFSRGVTKVVVYPGLGLLFVLVNDDPLFKVKTLAGPAEHYRLVFGVVKGGEIDWDFTLSTPTDAGQYTFLNSTSHYVSNTYRENSIIPFGALIEKQNGAWVFQDDETNKWSAVPASVAQDLELPTDKQDNRYYDINLDSDGKVMTARWASNDFGKYALLWSTDGKNRYPELGYAEGLLFYEQLNLVKDLADLITVPGDDSPEACIAQNDNFLIYRDIYNFINSKGETDSNRLYPEARSYYRLFNGFRLTAADNEIIDDRVLKAFNDYRAKKLPWNQDERQKTIGLYNFVRDYDRLFDKQAGWYAMVKEDWAFFAELREKSRAGFERYGVYSQFNRQKVVEKFINDRLEFKLVSPPPLKSQVSFTEYFKEDQEPSLFLEKEKEVLRGMIQLAASGEKPSGLEIESVKALNDYNLGVLLNDMLGNLYKSHGCLHVSPLNIYIVNQTLPVGAKVVIKDYSEKVDASIYEKLPDLANLVNFGSDVKTLAKKMADPKKVKVVVYPGSRVWIVYLNDQPFARMYIEPGMAAKVKKMQGRDPQGKPIFEDNVAYPTTKGSYYVFKKLKNYVSNIYYATTIMPQGAVMKKNNNNWVFKDEKGKWGNVPEDLQADINLPAEKRSFAYYDLVKDANGQLIEAKWGSNTFGWYPMQISANRKTPAPELIHTSGDLIMEERHLIGELIKILSAPKDSFEDCIKASDDFNYYATSYNFVKDPTNSSLLEPMVSGSYKLYKRLPLNTAEAAVIPKDVFAAYKAVTKQELSDEEENLLISEGVAKRQGDKLKVDLEKASGILFDVYEYVVAIDKNNNIYSTLKDRWKDIAPLRQALLNDFNKFKIKDPVVFQEFIRELIIKRAFLERLSQDSAYKTLEELLNKGGI